MAVEILGPALGTIGNKAADDDVGNFHPEPSSGTPRRVSRMTSQVTVGYDEPLPHHKLASLNGRTAVGSEELVMGTARWSHEAGRTGRTAADSDDIGALPKQFKYDQSSTEVLRDEITALEESKQALVASAAGDPVALFILYKVVEAESLDVGVLVDNLDAPSGWLSFGRLWRAELVDCYADTVVATDSGTALVEWFAVNGGPAVPSTAVE